MPRLVTSEDLGGLPSARSGRQIARYDESAIGESVVRAGSTVFGVGMDLADKWQKADASAFDAQFQSFQFEEDKRYRDATTNMLPGQARGFTDSYTAGYRERASAFLATVPEYLKPAFDAGLFTKERAIEQDAYGFEHAEQRRSALSTLGIAVSDKGVMSFQGGGLIDQTLFPQMQLAAGLKAGDPNKLKAWNDVQDAGARAIDANPGLSPIEKDIAKQKLRSAVQEVFLRALSPSEGMTADPSAGTRTIVEAIIGNERGGDNDNPDSTALGPGQFLEESWIEVLSQHRPDLTAGKSRSEILALRTDEALSREMVGVKVDENSRYLTSRGQSASPGNLYLAHFLGAGGAVAMLGANPESAAAMVNPAAAEANPKVFYNRDEYGRPDYDSPKSVAEVVAWAHEKMGDAEAVNWSEQADAVPYETKIAIASDAARRLVDQRNVEAAAAADAHKAQFNDLLNGIQDGTAGQTEIVEAYDNGKGWLTDYDERTKAIRAVEERDKEAMAVPFRSMPADQIEAAINAEIPSSGDATDADMARYAAKRAAAQTILKEREDDPAGYVQTAFPEVAQIWADVSEGKATVQDAVTLTADAERYLGIKKPRYLPDQVSDDAANKFKDVALPEQERIDALIGTVFATDDPEQRRAIFEQMVESGLPDMTEGAVEALARGDKAAARRLFQAALIDPTKLPGALPADITEAIINQKVRDEIMDNGEVGDVYYGLTTGQADNFERAQRDEKLIGNAIRLRLLNGETLDASVSAVAKDLYGDVQVITGNGVVNTEILLPVGEDPAPLLAGLAEAKSAVRGAMEKTMAIPVSPAAGARAARDQAIGDEGDRNLLSGITSTYIERVLEEGYFINADDGFVFIDPFLGAAVTDEDGDPLIVRPELSDRPPVSPQSSPFGGTWNQPTEDQPTRP